MTGMGPRLIPLSFGADVLPLIFTAAAVAGLLYLCYRLSRFLAKGAGRAGGGGGKNIRILERVALGPDKGLVIAEICGTFYLIGFSTERVEILKELDGSKVRPGGTGVPQNFLGALNSALRGRWDLTGNGRKNKGGRS
jgi:flagellar biogenesis protein FliO